MYAILAPLAGVDARDKSIMSKGIFNLLGISCATNCPILVILNKVF